ncbi:conserved hypothetical protein [Ricinus communis]|uniref:Uncharacterized protein n=1 Tax=Ricinus communis TaxID=3988 RepID=B9TCQ3_RICCO|nr:conserved hypothetical protein [Ricinus communis]
MAGRQAGAPVRHGRGGGRQAARPAERHQAGGAAGLWRRPGRRRPVAGRDLVAGRQADRVCRVDQPRRAGAQRGVHANLQRPGGRWRHHPADRGQTQLRQPEIQRRRQDPVHADRGGNRRQGLRRHPAGQLRLAADPCHADDPDRVAGPLDLALRAAGRRQPRGVQLRARRPGAAALGQLPRRRRARRTLAAHRQHQRAERRRQGAGGRVGIGDPSARSVRIRQRRAEAPDRVQHRARGDDRLAGARTLLVQGQRRAHDP